MSNSRSRDVDDHSTVKEDDGHQAGATEGTLALGADGTDSDAASIAVPPQGTKREFLIQEFMDPVHQSVQFTERELKVIDHPAFQRLFRIYQLGQTHLVFRGATHHRGDHALGATAVAEKLITVFERSYDRDKVLKDQARDDPAKQQNPTPPEPAWQIDKPLTRCEITFLRLAVLLHDIGHVAAGHTLEDELGFLEAHDELNRLEFIFDREDWAGVIITDIGNHAPETLTLRQLVDAEFSGNAEETGLQKTATEILMGIIAKDKEAAELAHGKQSKIRLTLLQDLVGDTVCVDLIDYLERDWRNIGKPKKLDSRLFEYLEIRTRERTKDSHVVVNLKSTPYGGHRNDAVSAVVELLEQRYQLWEVALLHRTKLAATAMLERALAEQADACGLFDLTSKAQASIQQQLLKDIVELSDSELYLALKRAEWTGSPGTSTSGTNGDGNETIPGRDLFWRLHQRILHKEVITIENDPAAQQVSERLAPLRGERPERLEAAKRRLESLRVLEKDFDAYPGAFALYIVPFGIGEKLAKVRVLYRDNVYPLSELEDSSHNEISGGHLSAQLKRFRGLWRATLFAAPEVHARLKAAGLLDDLGEVFRDAVLGISKYGDLREYAERVAGNAALSYARDNEMSNRDAVEAAQNGLYMTYPTGFAALRAYYT